MGDIFKVSDLTKTEHRALRALWSGTATAEQQQTGVAVIIKKLARYGDMTFIQGSQDGSAFLAGRAFVGAQLRRLVEAPVRDDGTEI